MLAASFFFHQRDVVFNGASDNIGGENGVGRWHVLIDHQWKKKKKKKKRERGLCARRQKSEIIKAS